MCVATNFKNVAKYSGLISVVISLGILIGSWIGGKAVASTKLDTLRTERTTNEEKREKNNTDHSDLKGDVKEIKKDVERLVKAVDRMSK